MKQYLDLLDHILTKGRTKSDRTGTGTIAVFGYQMRFDLQEGFPLLTTKKMFTKGIIHELLWFLQGSTNIKYLTDNGVHIWDDWADENGELGPVYGKQWRDWIYPEWPNEQDSVAVGHIDQIVDTIELLKNNPDSRRIIVSAWNPPDIPSMGLPPCHLLFQFNTRDLDEDELRQHSGRTKALSCQLYQRSCDTGLGVPFNIASYALLTMMFAQVVNMVPDEFIWVGGDTHIYLNHVDVLKKQLKRDPFPLPQMNIKDRGQDIFGFEYGDFELVDYQCHPGLKMDISV